MVYVYIKFICSHKKSRETVPLSGPRLLQSKNIISLSYYFSKINLNVKKVKYLQNNITSYGIYDTQKHIILRYHMLTNPNQKQLCEFCYNKRLFLLLYMQYFFKLLLFLLFFVISFLFLYLLIVFRQIFVIIIPIPLLLCLSVSLSQPDLILSFEVTF